AAALLCLFEWHLAWAAASGMETVLFAALALALIERTARPGVRPRDAAIFGALGGLLTVTRPEGLLLIGLAGAVALLEAVRRAMRREVHFPAESAKPGEPGWHSASRLQPTSRFQPGVSTPGASGVLISVLSFALFVFPAAWINLQASGTLFPNTFYAKQQEYAVYFSSLAAWLPRALDVLTAPFVGAQVLLMPGFLLEAATSLRRLRDRATWPFVLPLAWIAAHLAVYALRLPVTYQHGRYLMPILPAIVLIGLHGSAKALESIRRARRQGMPLAFLRRAALGSLIALVAAFWIVGAGAYRIDVNIIERELVASARWIETNTPPDALIAAHDIGAMGYFAHRPLLDLAGLISPEVIPIIRDEAALRTLLRVRRADYLAAPPGFYTTLLDAPELERVFSGDSPFAPEHWLVFRAIWE
ncbi:MAG TPA: hypothetical protein VIK33_11040, partial [Anaerolineae bacterium]